MSGKTSVGPTPALPTSDAFVLVPEVYDHLMRNVPYRLWLEYIERIVKHFRGRVADLLDLACGTGNMMLLLSEKGYRVVGVDLSEGMLGVARTKLVEAGHPAHLVLQDAAELSFGPVFDLTICLFDSLNYLLGADKLLGAFRGVYGALRPGGLFVFDLNTIRALRLNLFDQENLAQDDWLKYRWVSEYDSQSRICTVEMTYFVRQTGHAPLVFREVHRQMGYELAEVGELLEQAGFEVLAIYDAYREVRAHRFSTRAFFVVRK